MFLRKRIEVERNEENFCDDIPSYSNITFIEFKKIHFYRINFKKIAIFIFLFFSLFYTMFYEYRSDNDVKE